MKVGIRQLVDADLHAPSCFLTEDDLFRHLSSPFSTSS
jgi:hypothetical protein